MKVYRNIISLLETWINDCLIDMYEAPKIMFEPEIIVDWKSRNFHRSVARPVDIDLSPCRRLADDHHMRWSALEVGVSTNNQLV